MKSTAGTDGPEKGRKRQKNNRPGSPGKRIAKISRCTVEPSMSSLTTIREFIRTTLKPSAADQPLIDDIVAATHEAAKNAFEHNPWVESPVDVVCELRGDSVIVEVSDRGSGFDAPGLPPRRPDPMAPAGRGLFMIYSLMDEVEADTGNGGTRLRMLKRLIA